MTDEELNALIADTEQYASLITLCNYNRPKFNILARSILRPGVGLSNVVQSLVIAFDIDEAVGAQLDIIGKIIGLNRLLDYTPASGSREMDDDEYRLALKLTIAKNTWDGSLGSLSEIYKSVLGDSVTFAYIDNQDMTVDIEVYGSISTRQTEMLEQSGLLLVPVGVGKTVNVVGGDQNITLYAGVGISAIECVAYANAD